MSNVISLSPFLTVEEVAAYLRVANSTIYNWVYSKRIPYRKHGGCLVFHKAEIDAWSESRRNESLPSLSKFEQARARLFDKSNRRSS